MKIFRKPRCVSFQKEKELREKGSYAKVVYDRLMTLIRFIFRDHNENKA